MAEDKILERVTKLLALAEHPNTPAAEAELALEQAHRLMIKHAIAEAVVRQNQTKSERRAIGNKIIEVSFGTFSYQMRTMLLEIVRTNRCTAAWIPEGIHVFGADEDLRWTEMLYNMLHLQLLRKIDPKWDANLSYDHNVYNFKTAGFKWKQINMIAVKNGAKDFAEYEDYQFKIRASKDESGNLIPDHWSRINQLGSGELRVLSHEYSDENGHGYLIVQRATGKLKSGMLTAYKRHCKLIGDSDFVTTQNTRSFRLQYADAFVNQIAQRLKAIRDQNDSEMDSIPGAALALRSMFEEAEDEMYLMYPNLSPEELARLREEQIRKRDELLRREQEELDAMTPAQRDKFLEKRERERRRAAARNERYWEQEARKQDSTAHARGRAAANEIDLTRKAGYAEAGEDLKVLN